MHFNLNAGLLTSVLVALTGWLAHPYGLTVNSLALDSWPIDSSYLSEWTLAPGHWLGPRVIISIKASGEGWHNSVLAL